MNFEMMMNSLLENPMAKQALLWIGLGLGVGVVAKIIVPGNEQMGWIRTILMGLMGSFLGNYMAPRLLDWPSYAAFSLPGFGVGVAGAIILVTLNRLVTKS